MDRQEGYYWVKFKTKYQVAHFIILYGAIIWSIPGNETIFEDSDFEHINEVRIKEPGELPD